MIKNSIIVLLLIHLLMKMIQKKSRLNFITEKGNRENILVS